MGIMKDMNSSINLLFVQLPSALTHSSRLSRNLYKIFLKRQALDIYFYPMMLYPFFYQFIREIVGAMTTWKHSDLLLSRSQQTKKAMSKLMTNTVIGLRDIQIMNMYKYQL